MRLHEKIIKDLQIHPKLLKNGIQTIWVEKKCFLHSTY